MERYAIKEIKKKHNGKTYRLPIGVLAQNVETDEVHQFVTNEEKAKLSEIDTIKQSFQDGCNVLVSTCTTYGAAPENNSPSAISSAIGRIYNDRYNAGRLKGHDEVKADPSKYGINQIRDIYQNEVFAQQFEDISHSETQMTLWASFNSSDSVSYQIPLSADRILYGVAFDLEYYAIKGYDSPCSVAYAYSLETAEGVIIQSDRISAVTTGTSQNFGTVTKNVFIDLLQKVFSTVNENLILKLEYSMSGQVTSSQEQICQASIAYTNIQARYK